MITTEWTGTYPNLCSGEWIITINNKQIVDLNIKSYDSILRQSMHTIGVYNAWSFTCDYDEEWHTYSDGLEYIEWLKSDVAKQLFALTANNHVKLTNKQRYELYTSLQKNDWRNGSCGGCI